MFGREKKCIERLGRREISEKCVSSLSGACIGLFIALGTKNRGGRYFKANPPLIGLIFTPLDRY